ncbi:MAG: S-layer homology domain-containing protein [Clostridia bacterium]|nr:S-layer homology domain-containing protein [Clostridia bacterium]
MFKKGIALLLALCIFGSLIPFAAAEEEQVADSAPLSEAITETEAPTEIYEESLSEEAEEIPPAPVLRSPATYQTSAEGKVFIARMAGKDISSSMIAGAEGIVRTFAEKYDLELLQCQFDALVDFAFDCPGAFTNSIDDLEDKNNFENLLILGSYTDVSLADAMCGFVRTLDSANFSEISESMVKRRVREAKLFCHGDYNGTTDTICYVIFYPNGGKSPKSARCYAKGEAYSSLPVATKDGKSFAGWYSDIRNGSHISTSTIACSDLTVYARWGSSSVSDPNAKNNDDPASGRSDGVSILKNRSSDALIEFIQGHEGFVHYAVWDYAQYSIGYGSHTSSGDYPNGIYRKEADRLMRWMVYDFESYVTNCESKLPAKLKQQEYDALVSFTYNVGPSWASSSYRLFRYLQQRTTDLELVNAMGTWCNAGGEILSGLVYRRMDEAQMFLYGDYKRDNGGNLFQAINFRANGGTLAPDGKIMYYFMGVPYGTFAGAYRDDYTLSYWADKNGKSYSPNQIAAGDKFITLYAQWTQSTTPPPPIVDPDNPLDGYMDLDKDAWYAEAVAYMVQNGYMTGSSESVFDPAGEMTRAMLVSVLYRISGKSVSYEQTFADVLSDYWYANAVTWASKNGIVNGVGDNRFDPNGSITREQLAVILYNFTKSYGLDVPAQGDLSVFPDGVNVSNWAKNGVRWAVGMQLLSGQADETGKVNLAPGKTASRVEVASVLYRFLLAFGA